MADRGGLLAEATVAHVIVGKYADHLPLHGQAQSERRTEVVGIFPNEAAIIRLVGTILLEQNDEWMPQRSRYLNLETIATLSDTPLVCLPDRAA